jgi:shikimate dehydrogenase
MKYQSLQRLGIIGHPIAHTLSPAMHSAAIEELRIPFTYGVFDVVDEFLPALLASLRKNEFAGANVTIPYKERIIPLLDAVDQDALTIGAVNTIVNRNGKLTGCNTDAAGIQKSLEPFKEKIRKAPVVILGAGGGARAAAYAVSKNFSPASVRFYNRTAARAEKLSGQFRELFPGVVYDNISDEGTLRAAIAESGLIVNTTPAGMTPNIDTLPIPPGIRFSNHQIIFDIIYTPIETVLLRRAQSDGAATVNGVEMFVQQGAIAFELWTGKKFPVDVARGAVVQALTARTGI